MWKTFKDFILFRSGDKFTNVTAAISWLFIAGMLALLTFMIYAAITYP